MRIVSENRKQFEQWTLDYQKQKEQSDRLFSRISTFRILTFLIGAAGLIIGITEKEKSYATLLVIAGVLFLIGFVVLVKWHSVVAERQEMLTENGRSAGGIAIVLPMDGGSLKRKELCICARTIVLPQILICLERILCIR